MINPAPENEEGLREELEMLIPALQTPVDEEKFSMLMRTIQGIDALIVNSQLVWLTFRPSLVSLKAILETLKNNNFYPSDALENGHLLAC